MLTKLVSPAGKIQNIRETDVAYYLSHGYKRVVESETVELMSPAGKRVVMKKDINDYLNREGWHLLEEPVEDETAETLEKPVEDETPEKPVEDETPEKPVEDETPEIPVEDEIPEIPTDEVPVEESKPEMVEDDAENAGGVSEGADEASTEVEE